MWNFQKAFSLRTGKVFRFEIIDGVKHVKYVYCIKHAYNFFLREQVGFAVFFDACVNVFLVSFSDLKVTHDVTNGSIAQL